jgi:hypothetical protein
MESVGFLRALWGQRIFVALIAVLSLAAGISAGFRVSVLPPAVESSGGGSGFALNRVLVDTSRSLVADARAPGASTINARAILLGALMATDPMRARIAREAGLRSEDLAVVGPTTEAPLVATPLAEQAIEVTQPVQPNVVTVTVDPLLPILSIFAAAPDSKQADNVANAATDALASIARENPIGERAVKIDRLAKPQVGTRPAPSGLKMAALFTVGIFIICCFFVVLGHGIARRRVGRAGLSGGMAA